MKSISCLGTQFPSQRALAEAFGLDPAQVARRLRAGWTAEQAVEPVARPRPGTIKPVTAFGKTYRNLAEVALAYGADHALVANRVTRGYSVEDAVLGRLRPKKGARKEIVFEGKAYESREALCRAFGQSWGNVQRRVARGWTMRQALLLDEAPPRFRDFEGHARSHNWKVARVEGGRSVPVPGPGGYKLYVIRHHQSGKEYVGITTGDLEERFRQHLAAAQRGRKSALYNAIRSYGADAFSIALISDQAKTYAELEAMEIQEIARRNTIRKGYNTAQGGGLSTSKSLVVAGVSYPSIAAAADAHASTRAYSRSGLLGWGGAPSRPQDWPRRRGQARRSPWKSVAKFFVAYKRPQGHSDSHTRLYTPVCGVVGHWSGRSNSSRQAPDLDPQALAFGVNGPQSPVTTRSHSAPSCVVLSRLTG